MRPTSDRHDVFLAHNSRDKPQVEAVKAALELRGVRAWLDKDEIAPGRLFQDVIQQTVPRVKSVAVFFGPHGLGRWQAMEVRTFISQCVERDIPVIPVLLPGADGIPSELPFLKEYSWVSFGPSLTDRAAIDQLVWGITGEHPAARRGATKKAKPKKPPLATKPKKVATVNSSGEWVLLGNRFYRSKSVTSAGDRKWTVHLLSGGAEDEAAMRALDPGHFASRKVVGYAHSNHAFKARVQTLRSEAKGAVLTWLVDIVPEDWQFPSMYSMAIGGGLGDLKSPDQAAELRARSILLNEKLAVPDRSGFSSLFEGAVKVVEEPSLERLYAATRRSPTKFLRCARLALVYRLLASDVVEHVHRLSVTLKGGNRLAIDFRGVRKRAYSNAEPVVIAVSGEMTLNA